MQTTRTYCNKCAGEKQLDTDTIRVSSFCDFCGTLGKTLHCVKLIHPIPLKYKTETEIKNLTMEKEKTVLQEANDVIYGDRQADYGSATENFSNIAKGWEILLKTKVTPEQVGLCMIWLKMARQMNVNKRDNIVDIAGYAGCMEKLNKGE
jgi:hypothetical protein